MAKTAYHIVVIYQQNTEKLIPLFGIRKEIASVRCLKSTSELKGALKSPADLLFIMARDWDMHAISALEACQNPPEIVWLSGVHDKCVDELQAQVPFHFQEPLYPLDLDKLFWKLKTHVKQRDFNFLFIKYRYRYVKILFDDILYAERKAAAYYVLGTSQKEYLVNGNLVQLIKKIPLSQFNMVAVNLVLPNKLGHLVSHKVFVNENVRVKLSGRKLPVSYVKYLNAV